jgi:sensor histidine kinase YesM
VYSQEKLVENILHCLEHLEPSSEESGQLAAYLYIADSRLPEYLERLRHYVDKTNNSLQEGVRPLLDLVAG